MEYANVLSMKRAVMGCLFAVVLAAIGCADGQGLLTGPSASAPGPGLAATAPADISRSVSAAFPRSGALHVTKNCLGYAGQVGGFCTIGSSTVDAIETGTRVVYASAAGAASLDSDVVLDVPGPGNNKAFGHCALDFATGRGLCTFLGGTGKFISFHGSATVSYLSGNDWAWDGTYSFDPRD